ncbi:hypothetical protein GCM10011374_29820 [Kocuria dechangensis]|uniref:Uncharacterized protein n=1 Tax=Kocuria dechangensis TaxID=1176249 RepID=A0A917LWW2_9MICC|nr:hypothetical protein GCM10011374_29820 [Kocuria dechangensis]
MTGSFLCPQWPRPYSRHPGYAMAPQGAPGTGLPYDGEALSGPAAGSGGMGRSA